MNTTIIPYMDYLQEKLHILEEIYANTMDQSLALEKKDDLQVEKLLIARQLLIDKLAGLNHTFIPAGEVEKGSEILKMEQAIQALLTKVCRLTEYNVQQATQIKDEAGKAMQHIRIGMKAMMNGYFKKPVQRYGYFVDKKLGNRIR